MQVATDEVRRFGHEHSQVAAEHAAALAAPSPSLEDRARAEAAERHDLPTLAKQRADYEPRLVHSLDNGRSWKESMNSS